MKAYLRIATVLICFLPYLIGSTVLAQHTKKSFRSIKEAKEYDFTHHSQPTDNNYVTVYTDTIDVSATDVTRRDSILTPLHVVTNTFGKNWFVFATGGVHSFRGDYSNTHKFSGTLSPDWSVGLGKWFTPGIALKLEFIKSDSRGYTEYLTGHYGYGPIDFNKNLEPYRKMKTSWWDLSGAVVLNFTRLFLGYEGYESPKRMNQFMCALGFGGVHHTGFGHTHGSDNEWSGHVELQYSRFFTKAKRFSLDLKARGIFYQTNFDLEYGVQDRVSNKWDMNIGLDLGFTYYLGHKRADGWGNSVTQIYERDFKQRDILVYRERTPHILSSTNVSTDKTMKTFTFYVFYPNNYSGRNDAPVVPDADVNAIDYLAGGIFTQKKFIDNTRAANILHQGGTPRTERTIDIPTVPATEDINTNGLPRGYEMHNGADDRSKCLSYSMIPRDMLGFMDAVGYCYAPIWDGLHEWGYRIDQETYRQQLLSSANYRDTESYGLNAHSGLATVDKMLQPDEGDYLISFADVYAAINGNTGYISQFANPETVEELQKVFKNGLCRLVEAHGVATSQDNYTGNNAERIGYQRNSDLANYRAETVRTWLMGTDYFKDAKSLIYIDDKPNSINRVTDPSTRGLAAKTNRYVKVRLQVIY